MITYTNRGQVIKEYLAEQGIQAAHKNQRKQRAPRRSKKRLPGGKVSFPMYSPVQKLQKKVSDRIESGDIPIGQEVVPTACPRYTVQHGELTLESTDVYARKIPLLEIRERLLKQHKELGIVRQNPDAYYATLSEEVVKTKLTELHETIDPTLTPEELREKLKSLNRHRLLKVWHDHSEIAGHSHLLVLVAAVYDPAFFFTPEEMQLKGVNIDVPTVVEEPQVHIFGRSSSSLDDQSQFIECRRECLLQMGEVLHTKAGIPIHDVMRYFHGDGPAMQFEAGNKVGGHYSCVGCQAQTSRFSDLAYCFRANRCTLAERQRFILQGEAWKQSRINPLEKLRVAQLRTELEKRGVDTEGKMKPQLEKELRDLQTGTSNVPALLLNTPQASLDSLNLGNYEVFPTEPLHDLKGHMHNILAEVTKAASGETLQILRQVQDTVLNKCTLRCSDYRKAVILIYKSLQQSNNPDAQIMELFRTAVEITEIMYAPDSKRTPRMVLRFHNLVYQHGKVCNDLFAHDAIKNPVFGRYFHSITCHAPLLLRVICLRSVNTEVQERMFGQAKQITKSTSSLRANHVITNFLIRNHEEANAQANPLTIQEGEIHNLAQTLGPNANTIIPYSWLSSNPTLHQAHLERIGDFLLPGPGVWWRYTHDGIEFHDSLSSQSQHPEGPDIHHVRSASLSDIDIYLHHKWEECCCRQVPLPAYHIRSYGSHGSLTAIIPQPLITEGVSELTHESPMDSTDLQVPPQITTQSETEATDSQVSPQSQTPQPLITEGVSELTHESPMDSMDSQVPPQPDMGSQVF